MEIPLDLADRHQQYAQAFEKFIESDDASLLELHFTEDAVHEVFGEPFAARIEGRHGIIANMRESLNGLDRRCDSRTLDLESREEDGVVRARGVMTVRLGEGPAGVLEVEEIAYFEGDRISRLEDHIDPESGKAFTAWLAAHDLISP